MKSLVEVVISDIFEVIYYEYYDLIYGTGPNVLF